jgi:hypothetical protein
MPRACHSQKARRAKGRPRWRREGARRCSIAETEWLGGEKRSLDLSEAFLEAGAHDRLQTFSDAFVVTRCISSACTNGAGIGVLVASQCKPVSITVTRTGVGVKVECKLLALPPPVAKAEPIAPLKGAATQNFVYLILDLVHLFSNLAI